MATTKKVASAGSLKKKAVPKKSVSSSRAKTLVKKKAVKKTVVKKAVAPKKKTSAKIEVKKEKKTTKAKVKVVKIKDRTTKSSSIKQTPKVSKANTSKSADTKKRSVQAKVLPAMNKIPIGLAVLSVTRLPINLDTFAMQTARVGGLMIVVMGGFFTLQYSQYIWNAPIVAADVSGVQMLGLAGGCDSSTLSQEKYKTCVANETTVVETVDEPPMTFSIEGAEPLSGIVPITIRVESAQSVDVLVFRKSYETPIKLGAAKKVSQGVWTYHWDTTKKQDDFYKVAADVTNAYTTGSPYRDADGKYLQIVNTPQVKVQEVVEEPNAPKDAPVSLDETPYVELRLKSSNTKKSVFEFEAEVPEAEKVTVKARHVASDSENILGDAKNISGNIWLYTWDASDYKDGDYEISTKVSNEFGSYSDGVLPVEVKHYVEPEVETKPRELKDEDDDDEDDREPIVLPKIPEARLQLTNASVLSGSIELKVTIDEADFVELWMIPEGSQTRKIIGLAKRSQSDETSWVYRWNTERTPNAKYKLFARVKNSFGVYESNVEQVSLFNEPYIPLPTKEQVDGVKQIQEASKIEQEVGLMTEFILPEDQIIVTPDGEKLLSEVDVVTRYLFIYSGEINGELQRLTTAYRSGDTDAIERAEARMERLSREITSTIERDIGSDEFTSSMEEKIKEIVIEHKVLSEKAEKLITNRVGADVFKDSDSDGISDYDELTLYMTDPFTADTDGDGFIDGLEVADGFDPLDSKREVVIVYESPQEKGVVRDDILKVNSIETVIPETPEEDTDGVDAQAVISGMALPNSFVTLYVFSTPIVVTVKTEEDGSWKYRFDKELEDGEHNIYVGLTDNAGRIVAKSEPFAFVKEAQAFSPANTTIAGTATAQQGDDALLSTYMIYLILSISVVSIGLVLILLGLHLDTRQRRFKGVVNSEE